MLLLSNETQTTMYNGVRKLTEVANNGIDITQELMIKMIKPLMIEGKKIEEWLNNNGIGLKDVHIVSAFYLINVADTQLKDPLQHSDSDIENTFATMVNFGLGHRSFTPEQVGSNSIDGVRDAIQWLNAHPVN